MKQLGYYVVGMASMWGFLACDIAILFLGHVLQAGNSPEFMRLFVLVGLAAAGVVCAVSTVYCMSMSGAITRQRLDELDKAGAVTE